MPFNPESGTIQKIYYDSSKKATSRTEGSYDCTFNSQKLVTKSILSPRREGSMHDLTQEERVADQAEKVATQPEYDLLGHLSKLPAHISILELLRTSPKHKELFFHFHQEAQVPATLTPEELQDVVWSNRLRPNMHGPLQKRTYQRGGIHPNKWSVVRCLIIRCRTICFVALGLTSNLGFGMDSLSERSRANPPLICLLASFYGLLLSSS